MRSRVRKLVLATAATTLVVSIGYALTQQTLPQDAGSSCATSLTATEFDTWFDSGAVSLDGAVKPANSVTFPNTPNCSFYKWSEQMFLWLTSPAPARYGGGGLVMNTPVFYDVSLPDSLGHRQFVPHSSGMIRAFNLRTAQRGTLDLPIVLERKTLRMLEVLPPVLSAKGLQLVADQDGREVEVGGGRITDEHGTPVLLDVSGKEIKAPRALLRPDLEKQISRLENFDKSELVQQIAIDDATTVLLDLFGNFPATEQGQADGGVLMAQNGSLVYYALTVNNVFSLYRTMQGPTVQQPNMFPVNQTDLNAITAFAAAHGQAPVIDSEALAIEIKTSWVEAAGLADAGKFIQMKAVVPTYDKTDPNDWVPNGTTTVMLAMVGMHIVGSTNGHPEMLWATFEHLSNGPAEQYDYAKAPSGTVAVPRDTTGDWVFCTNGSQGPFNEAHMRMAGSHIVPVIPPLPASPFTISPSDIVRTMPWGLDGSNSAGNAEVISLNHTVRSLLDPADIRRNYFHEGTTWTIFGASPNGSNEVGTNRLENTTMETFNQGGNHNCFNCHTTNTTHVSHVFENTSPLF